MHLVIDLTTVDGEHNYTETMLATTDEGQSDREKAEQIASTYLSSESEGKEEDWWTFKGDYRRVFVKKVKIVTETEYQVLQKYLDSV
jgi:hypothetical protein